MRHSVQIRECHSPQRIEIDTGGVLEHSGADCLRNGLLILRMMVEHHHRLHNPYQSGPPGADIHRDDIPKSMGMAPDRVKHLPPIQQRGHGPYRVVYR